MKILNSKLLVFFAVFLSSLSFAQENFKHEALALLEDIAINSKHKSIVEFVKKENFELMRESAEDDGSKTYSFLNPSGELLQVIYNKSNKITTVGLMIESDFPVLIDIQTHLVKHGFKNPDYEYYEFSKSSYPYKFITTKSKDEDSLSIVFLITKDNANF